MSFKLLLIRTIFGIVNLFPISWRIEFFALLIRIATFLLPRLKEAALINLEIVFPELSIAQRLRILKDSSRSWGRMIVDVLRVHQMSDDWIKDNVEFPDLDRFREAIKKGDGKGALFLTAHFGSYELLVRFMPLFHKEIAFIARPLKPASLNEWWTRQRTKFGCTLIMRGGAIKKMIKLVRKGVDVGIVFDQNVTRKHAIFVDWFGLPAATAKAPVKVAISNKCPIVIFTMEYTLEGKYKINMIARDYNQIYSDYAKSEKQKVFIIAEQIAKDFEKLILKTPADWLWFHRRWKTAANPGEGRKIYSKREND